MSFIASLEVDGESYTILDCSFGFNQPIGTSSKPSGKTQGGQLDITLELHKNIGLVDWMVNATTTKSGEVIFYNRDSLSKQLTLKFENAFCTNLRAIYHADDDQPLKFSLILTSEALKVNAVEHANSWQ